MNIFKRTAFPILACFLVWSSGHGLTTKLKVVSAGFGPRMIMNALDPGLLIKAKIPDNIPEALYRLRVSLAGPETGPEP
jgi:hypothetical protein